MWPCPRCSSAWTHAREAWRRQCGDCGEVFDLATLEVRPEPRRRTLGRPEFETDPVSRRFAGVEVDD